MGIKEAVISAGLIGGYADTMLQITEGPGHAFEYLRDMWEAFCGSMKSEAGKSFAQLAHCGWCLAPWLTVPLFSALCALLTGKHRKRDYLVGSAVATSLAAFLRHYADTY